MPSIEVLSQFFPLGIGGILAIIVVHWKREDDKRYAESLRELITRHDQHITRLEARDERMLEIIQRHTDVLSGLQSAISLLVDVDKLETRITRRGN